MEAVAQVEELSSSDWKVPGSFPWFKILQLTSVLEKDTEPQIIMPSLYECVNG